jgi:putative ABC transport system ATP-binding protein
MLTVDSVSFSFGDKEQKRLILDRVSLRVEPGEVLFLLGPSGSGKSTLLSLIGGFRTLQGGTIALQDLSYSWATQRRLIEIRRRIGFVFQSHNLIKSLTARQNVELALELHLSDPGHRRRRALEVLDSLGLAHRCNAFPAQLSGGEQQRVSLARALAGEPAVILADEPTASLDRDSGLRVVEQMVHLARERGAGVLLVTHDERIRHLADRAVEMEDGRLRTSHGS